MRSEYEQLVAEIAREVLERLERGPTVKAAAPHLSSAQQAGPRVPQASEAARGRRRLSDRRGSGGGSSRGPEARGRNEPGRARAPGGDHQGPLLAARGRMGPPRAGRDRAGPSGPQGREAENHPQRPGRRNDAGPGPHGLERALPDRAGAVGRDWHGAAGDAFSADAGLQRDQRAGCGQHGGLQPAPGRSANCQTGSGTFQPCLRARAGPSQCAHHVRHGKHPHCRGGLPAPGRSPAVRHRRPGAWCARP